MKRIYLDHNATTPLHPEVRKSIIDSMDLYGNPSSLHADGREARALLEEARGRVAALINAEPGDMMFVGSGSEANNTVLSILGCTGAQCGIHPSVESQLVTSTIEHPCILETSKCLENRGASVARIGVDERGLLRMEDLEEALARDTSLVSIMMVNNETGAIQDVRTALDLAHRAGALFHTDAVQAVGKIPVDVRELEVDFLTVSAHKIYGPKGVGALYVRRGTPFCPLIRGGHQEMGRRAGTENTLGITGFGIAAEMRGLEMEAEGRKLEALNRRLREGIIERIDDIHFNSFPEHCVHSTLNVSFAGVEGEAMLLYLDMEGIEVSTGSACASGSLDPSHVLLEMGLPVEYSHGSLRISMGRSTTEDDVERVLEVLPGVVRRLRKMSTAWGGSCR
ncbi:MAG: cysteine desulfurase NifS [Candidatus Aegiribacteria sp. MLS_C]|nr:MAG: cysteine desulfurase NifS [Candidatus Aegiribacteria sp. MLS_C]